MTSRPRSVERRSPRLALAAALTAVALGAAPRPASGQAPGGRCDLVVDPVPATATTTGTRFTSSRLPSGNSNTFIGGGLRARCAGQDITLRSDSAESYGDSNVIYLIGDVHYAEPRVKLDAQRLTYWRAEERLLAQGSVYAVLPSGTTMRGPNADYYRAVLGIRDRSRMVATGRPVIKLVQRDSAGRAQEPVDVVSDRVTMEADSLVYAGGRVVITRPDLVATGDSAFMDSGREFARLMRGPVIKGKAERPFTLSGRVVDLFSRQRQLERVLAVDSARAVSEDMDLRSDTLDLRVTANKLQRGFAWGRSRAHAASPGNDVTADSIDIRMPDQRVRELRAVGKAEALSRPDTTKLRSPERDWLRGDTVIAYFDTVPARDTARKPHIDHLVATGDARSFYQIPADSGPTARPSINYVRGKQITVAFVDQQVRTVTVSEQAAGIYLEPATDSSRATTAGTPATGAAPAGAAGRPPAATGPARPSTRPPGAAPAGPPVAPPGGGARAGTPSPIQPPPR